MRREPDAHAPPLNDEHRIARLALTKEHCSRRRTQLVPLDGRRQRRIDHAGSMLQGAARRQPSGRASDGLSRGVAGPTGGLAVARTRGAAALGQESPDLGERALSRLDATVYELLGPVELDPGEVGKVRIDADVGGDGLEVPELVLESLHRV